MKHKTYKIIQNLMTFSYLIIFGSFAISIMFLKGFLLGFICLIIVFAFFILFRIRDKNDIFMKDDVNVATSETEDNK